VNPLGITVPGTVIEELAAWCDTQGIYLLVDEAYKDYVFEGDYQSTVPLVSRYERLVSCHTFSKNMAMSGWRIGYLIIPKSLLAPLAGMQGATLNCLNNTAQYAAAFALDHPEFARQFSKIVNAGRMQAITALQPLVDQNIISYSIPPAGFFLFMKVGGIASSKQLCDEILDKTHVGLIPGSSFGPSGEGWIRLCFARDEAVLSQGLERLQTFFMSLHSLNRKSIHPCC
jgi:aspartate/methionine/tyrosine aminotransferase